MLTKYTERCALRSCSEGGYLCINAVNNALSIGEVLGEPPNVVKLDQ